VGILVGRSMPDRVVFLSNRPVKVGEFVMVDAAEGRVLYMVERSETESKLLSTVRDFITAEEAQRASKHNPRDRSYTCLARALGMFRDGWMPATPSIPPEPGSYVYEVDDKLLRAVYRMEGEEWVEVGRLLRRPSVGVAVNLNKVASRHLAILATTGKGKSNLIALIAKRTAEKNGTMVIFDYHAEYSQMKSRKTHYVAPRINPRNLDSEELADLLDVRSSAEKQRSILSNVFRDSQKRENFWEDLRERLSDIVNNEESDSSKAQAASRLLEIIERALSIKGRIFDEKSRTVLESLKKNRINVVDLSEFTEKQAQILLRHFLLEILNDRKNAVLGYDATFTSPVLVAVEEAHVFIPADKGGSECADVVSRVAREGRKFGVGLIIVSQRPNRLDPDVVSQMGSFAISGITHPEDQAFITKSTDFVSEELGVNLPCLNTGEMIFAGQWVKTTTLVLVDKVEEKLIGRDLDAVKQWLEDREATLSSPEDLIRP